jgi:hypothetical protein
LADGFDAAAAVSVAQVTYSSQTQFRHEENKPYVCRTSCGKFHSRTPRQESALVVRVGFGPLSLLRVIFYLLLKLTGCKSGARNFVVNTW